MPRLQLIAAPDYIDDLGRACFHVDQQRGLVQHQSDVLLAAPELAGYCAAIDEPAFRAIADRVRVLARGRLLDVIEIGGTTGHFFDRIRDVTRTYTNIEPGTPTADDTTRRRLADDLYQVVRCSAEDLPISGESVDIVLALASLDHIPEVERALREIHRVLRPGGCAIVTLNNRGSWWKRLLKSTEVVRSREIEIAKDHYFQWTARECARHVGAFLRIRELSTRTYLPYLPWFWRVLMPVADLIGSRVAPLGGSITIITAERD